MRYDGNFVLDCVNYAFRKVRYKIFLKVNGKFLYAPGQKLVNFKKN